MDETNEHVDPNQLNEAPVALRRHPFRALFWSLLLGIGLALVLIVTKVITLAIQPIVIVLVVVVVLGVLWGLFGPAKEPKGPVPVVVMPGTVHESTRFDEFGDPGPRRTGPLDAPVPTDEAPTPVAPTPEVPDDASAGAETSTGGGRDDDTAGSDDAKSSDG